MPSRDRELREVQLAALEGAGVPPTPIWLRFLSQEGVSVAGDTALATVAERYGADGSATVAAWHAEISAAIDRSGGNYREATRIALREGPRVSLLLVPQGAYERAVAPHAETLRSLVPLPSRRRRLARRRTG